jgi:hypothetical protein
MRSDAKRLVRPCLIALVAAGLLSACGQGSSATTVVLSGPHDKVAALVARHKALAPPVQAQVEALDDGGERATFHLPKGVPFGEVVALGKDAARTGVNYNFSSGTNWSAGGAIDERPAQPSAPPAVKSPARSAGPIA